MKYLYLTIIIFGILFLANNANAAVIVRPVLHSGLVGYWSMDEGAGSMAYDHSGNGNHGTLTNMDPSTDWVNGKQGQALQFDGVDDTVQRSSLSQQSSGSIAFWFKPSQFINSADGRMGMIGSGPAGYNNGDFRISFNEKSFLNGCASSNTGILSIGVESGDNSNFRCAVATQASYSSGVWHYVVVSWTSSVLKLYVDNVLEDSQASTYPLFGLGNFLISSSVVVWYDGALDEVRIYNRALSADEISRLYKMTRPSVKTPTTDGLVGYWSMDEGTGTLVGDMSGNGNHGTMTQMDPATDWVNGKLGKALDFDGSNDYVDAGDGTSLRVEGGEFTIAMWIKAISVPDQYDTIFEKSDNFGIGMRLWFNGSNYGFTLKSTGDGNALTSGNLGSSVGNWIYLTGTYNYSSKVMNFYENGVYKSTYTKTENPDSSAGKNLVFGKDTTSGRLFDGLIDEVRIYDRALSAGEIQTLYQSGAAKINSSTVGKLTDGLVGHWTFDGPDMAGVTAYDKSGQGNNGTLTNGPARAIGKLGQALDFDGVDDYVISSTMTGLPTGSNPSTISLWIKLDSTTCNSNGGSSNSCELFWYGNDGSYQARLMLIVKSTGLLKVGLWNNEKDTTIYASNLIDGFHHITWVHESNNSTVYFDGVLRDGPIAHSGAATVLSDGIMIGKDPYQPRTFDGTIDEVRIYNRALSAEEITRLYNLGR